MVGSYAEASLPHEVVFFPFCPLNPRKSSGFIITQYSSQHLTSPQKQYVTAISRIVVLRNMSQMSQYFQAHLALSYQSYISTIPSSFY